MDSNENLFSKKLIRCLQNEKGKFNTFLPEYRKWKNYHVNIWACRIRNLICYTLISRNICDNRVFAKIRFSTSQPLHNETLYRGWKMWSRAKDVLRI